MLPFGQGLDGSKPMSSFFAAQYYSPVLVLLAGLVTFAGVAGVGLGSLRLLNVVLPAPWNQAIAPLLGVLILSLGVQVLGMTHIASYAALALWWSMNVAVGMCVVYTAYRHSRVQWNLPKGWDWPFALLLLVSLFANLLVAVAPSTKMDELYYHMVLPSRIVNDAGLIFYREPWLAAIFPQMIFQIAATPLHALGIPDAANVVSWCLSLTLVLFIWRLLIQDGQNRRWAFLWCGVVVAGTYTGVWHVTGGGHAMGDLAATVAVASLLRGGELLEKVSSRSRAVLISIATASMVATKISLAPLAFLILLLGIVAASRKESKSSWTHSIAFGSSAWIVFLLPLTLWTWWASGSPLGPIGAGAVGQSVYDSVSIGNTLQTSRMTGQTVSWADVLVIGTYNSFLLWAASLGALISSGLAPATRRIALALLGLQILLVVFFLPSDPRFLGGLQFGLAVCFASSVAAGRIARLFSGKVFNIVFLACVLPWTAGQVYYAAPIATVSLYLARSEDFLRRYVALYADYVALDALLPKEAVLLTPGRVSGIYAPRPVYYDLADVPSNREVYELWIGANGALSPKPVYDNPQAVVDTYRTPGRLPEVARVAVFKLLPADVVR